VPTHGGVARLSRPGWLWLNTKMVYPRTVTHPSTNRARRRATTLIKTNALPLSQTATGRLMIIINTYAHLGRSAWVGRSSSSVCPHHNSTMKGPKVFIYLVQEMTMGYPRSGMALGVKVTGSISAFFKQYCLQHNSKNEWSDSVQTWYIANDLGNPTYKWYGFWVQG